MSIEAEQEYLDIEFKESDQMVGAKFSLPEAVGLLTGFGIILD